MTIKGWTDEQQSVLKEFDFVTKSIVDEVLRLRKAIEDDCWILSDNLLPKFEEHVQGCNDHGIVVECWIERTLQGYEWKSYIEPRCTILKWKRFDKP